MSSKQAIKVLAQSFAALTATEFRRLQKYRDAGRQFLCGDDAPYFSKNGEG